MRKMPFLLLVMVLVLSLALTGCGVAQDKYDAVVNERDNALSQVAILQNDVERLENDLAVLQSEIDKLGNDYEAAQSSIGALQGEVSKAQGEYDTLKQKTDKAKPYAEILEKYYFLPAFQITASQLLDLSSLVNDTGDTKVKEKLLAYLSNPTAEKQTEFYIAVWDGLWNVVWGADTST